MTHVLLLRSLGAVNRGNIAVQVGCINSIKASIPDALITVWSIRVKEDKFYEQYGIRVFPHPWVKRRNSKALTVAWGVCRITLEILKSAFFRVSTLVSKQNLSSYGQFDIVIDTNMDGLNDRHYGTLFTLQNLVFPVLAKIIINKPLVLLPASIGPFKNNFVKLMAKIILNQYDMIVLRGDISKKYIHDLGVNKPSIVRAEDLGFLLNPCSIERTSELLKTEGVIFGKGLLVGFSPSDEISNWAFPDIIGKKEKRVKYIQLMSKVADYLIEKYNATICFIPNIRNDHLTKGSADAVAAEQIIQLLKNKTHVKIISDRYSAEDTKGIIGHCDLYLSSRMHASIAAVSMGIPTIVTTYGVKFDDVIGGTIGQESYMVRVDKSDYSQISNELKSKVDDLYANRNRIKGELIEKAKLARQNAILFGNLIKQITKSSHNA